MSIVIWIDPEIDNFENKNYLQELNNFLFIKIKAYKNIDEGLEYIKSLRFEVPKIILCGKLYYNFIQKFKENFIDIFVIPKIIIFTFNKNKQIEKDENINLLEDKFFNFGGIKTDFEEIKKFIKDKKEIIFNVKEEPQLTFEYIDMKAKLALPLVYKVLLEETNIDETQKFTKLLDEKYSKNYEDIKKLLQPIKKMPSIPVELLCKYTTLRKNLIQKTIYEEFTLQKSYFFI